MTGILVGAKNGHWRVFHVVNLLSSMHWTVKAGKWRRLSNSTFANTPFHLYGQRRIKRGRYFCLSAKIFIFEKSVYFGSFIYSGRHGMFEKKKITKTTSTLYIRRNDMFWGGGNHAHLYPLEYLIIPTNTYRFYFNWKIHAL